jgi:1-aminocyclopropane-1-carboxylate deaminase/D-cysteine desulfhydrase-like pyridoxal-dependent ACC family enzyme
MSPAPRQSRLPSIEHLLGKESLAHLPTPVREYRCDLAGSRHRLSVKLDNLTGDVYGGNKVRKLEYILHRAREKNCERVATFGTVASHHALATSLYAKRLGFPCICFLSHQVPSPAASRTLRLHLQIGTSLVRYGGPYKKRLHTLRQHLWGRNPWVVPIGGTSWLGAFAYVCAGLELAAQVAEGLVPPPDRLYVAAGTMGTAAGLALGLALAGMGTEVQAIRVSDTSICNESDLKILLDKTARMMHRLDRALPRDLGEQANITLRHEFFAGGYARTDDETDAAIRFATDELDLELEGTYTGKAMAAVIRDLPAAENSKRNFLFWNTFNSVPLAIDESAPVDTAALPGEFLRYVNQEAGPRGAFVRVQRRGPRLPFARFRPA